MMTTCKLWVAIQRRNDKKVDSDSDNAFGHSIEVSCTGIERGKENVVQVNKDENESKSLHPLCLSCTPTESTTFDDSGDEEDEIILWRRSHLEPECYQDSSEHSFSVNNDKNDEFSAMPLDKKSQLDEKYCKIRHPNGEAKDQIKLDVREDSCLSLPETPSLSSSTHITIRDRKVMLFSNSNEKYGKEPSLPRESETNLQTPTALSSHILLKDLTHMPSSNLNEKYVKDDSLLNKIEMNVPTPRTSNLITPMDMYKRSLELYTRSLEPSPSKHGLSPGQEKDILNPERKRRSISGTTRDGKECSQPAARCLSEDSLFTASYPLWIRAPTGVDEEDFPTSFESFTKNEDDIVTFATKAFSSVVSFDTDAFGENEESALDMLEEGECVAFATSEFALDVDSAFKHEDFYRGVGIYLEQSSCAFATSISFNDILRNLPDCIPEKMSHMEHNLTKLVQKNVDDVEALPTNQLLEGKTAGDNALLGIEPLGHDSPKTECKCSAKKIFRSLRLLPPEEVDNILRERGQLEALCQICGTVYSMEQEEAGRRFLGANGYPSKYK